MQRYREGVKILVTQKRVADSHRRIDHQKDPTVAQSASASARDLWRPREMRRWNSGTSARYGSTSNFSAQPNLSASVSERPDPTVSRSPHDTVPIPLFQRLNPPVPTPRPHRVRISSDWPGRGTQAGHSPERPGRATSLGLQQTDLDCNR